MILELVFVRRKRDRLKFQLNFEISVFRKTMAKFRGLGEKKKMEWEQKLVELSRKENLFDNSFDGIRSFN